MRPIARRLISTSWPTIIRTAHILTANKHMGTRNLTMVRSRGKVKVAQYGQWDGYPLGQGETIAKFLRTVKLDDFKKRVNALKKWTDTAINKAYIAEGHNGSEWVTCEISDKVKAKHPELSRDTGAEILNLIYSGKCVRVSLNEKFKEDKLFCEYWYEINLDDETVTMNDKKYTFKQWTRKGMMADITAEENAENEE